MSKLQCRGIPHAYHLSVLQTHYRHQDDNSSVMYVKATGISAFQLAAMFH